MLILGDTCVPRRPGVTRVHIPLAKPQVPHGCSRKQLLAFTCAPFPCARTLVLKGDYPALRPADVDELLRAWGNAGPQAADALSVGAASQKPRRAWHAEAPAFVDVGGGRFTSLALSELLLSGPLPVSTITTTLCTS